MNRAISFSAMLVTLLLSFLLDRGSSQLKRGGMEQFDSDAGSLGALRSQVVGDVIADLIFVLALSALSWIVLSVLRRDALMAWLFVVVGLGCMLYVPLVMVGPPGVQAFLTSSGFGVSTREFRMTLMSNGFGAYFGLGSAGGL